MGIVTAAQAAVVAVHSGTLSTTDGGLVATSPWDEGSGSQVSWEITFDTDTQLYEYHYEINVNHKDISGVIIEACQDCTVYPVNDLQYDTVNALGVSEGVYRPGHHGASTPGLPGTIAGGKFKGDNSTTMSVTITTAIAPVWGNIYAKGGMHHGDPVYLYNADFGSPGGSPDGPVHPGADNGNSLPVVGCTVTPFTPVPEPSSTGLLFGGIFLLTLLRKRR